MRSRAFTVAVALTTIAPRLSAQAAAGADTARSRDCWRGHRAPVCRSFFLTEFGGVRVLTSSSSHFAIDYGEQGGVQHFSEPDFGRRFQFTVGPMYNVSPSRALGATVSFSSVHNGFRAAFEARHRWWGPGDQALDLSAGPLRIDVPSVSPVARRTEYGVTAGAHLVANDLIHLTGRADLTFGRGGAHPGITFEFGVGSWMTAVVAPVVLFADALANSFET